jgi:hypothetical protein
MPAADEVAVGGKAGVDAFVELTGEVEPAPVGLDGVAVHGEELEQTRLGGVLAQHPQAMTGARLTFRSIFAKERVCGVTDSGTLRNGTRNEQGEVPRPLRKTRARSTLNYKGGVRVRGRRLCPEDRSSPRGEPLESRGNQERRCAPP